MSSVCSRNVCPQLCVVFGEELTDAGKTKKGCFAKDKGGHTAKILKDKIERELSSQTKPADDAKALTCL